ncbi:MAG: hypothetical protein H7A50_17005 [Akkermansiaceae bacterium]|nr:hypothetical protein [Akkermansiaceae bacterium]
MKFGMFRNPVFLAVVLFGGSLSAEANTKIISVNLTEFATDIQQIDSDETFGIASEGTVAGGWVNLNAVNSASDLADSAGFSTSVDFGLTAPNQKASFSVAYDDTPLKSGIDDYTNTATPVSVTLSDLNATFPDGCKVIVYLGGFNANSGASISDGTTTYYYQTADSPVAPVAFVSTTDTTDDGDNTAPEAQYAVFGSDLALLTSDSVTLTIDCLYGGGAAICAVQVIGEGLPPLPVSGPVSVNFKQFPAAVNDPLEPYGVEEASNWTNLESVTSGDNLITDGGGPSTIDLVATAPGRFSTWNFDVLNDTPMRAGIGVYATPTTVTLSDINATFSTYDVIVYVGGFNGAAGGNQGSISDGTTTYVYSVPNPFTASLVQSTDTDSGDGSDPGTYVRFSGLTADSVTLTMTTLNVSCGIGGIQIVGTPAVSRIPIVSVDRDAGSGELTVVFESQAGKTYSAFGGTDLADAAAWPELSTTDIVDDGGTATFQYTPPGAPPRFFLRIGED